MEKRIIGREDAIRRLKQYVESDHSEFVVIYGRRRIGKTFLIKELFEGQFAFRITGKENVKTAEQLNNFYFSLSDFADDIEKPKTWAEAFRILRHYLEKLPEGPKILFFDELPWLDTARSSFLSNLEHFWNSWADYRNDIKIIACGSATSWMLNKVINNRGGLHNRVTHQILLKPFCLGEVEEYFHAKGFAYSRQEIIETYMAVGGVAYYLSLFDKEKSVAQNIEKLCFEQGGELTHEFPRLFKSLFKKSKSYEQIIDAVQEKGMGLTRKEIMENAKLDDNGNLSKMLREMEECDFIRSYTPFGKRKKDTLYQLIDPFSLFYLRFMGGEEIRTKDYWQKIVVSNNYKAWCGYAFEILCLHHLDQIVESLGIGGTISKPCSWFYRPPKKLASDADENLRQGAQIDLLIDRYDSTITICEMKYSDREYTIDKEEDALLLRRVEVFKTISKTRKSVVPAYITPQGLANNMYSRRVLRQVVGDDLFKKFS